ncbi:unnamed protein product [Acanthoscelides obtectus]|uniref:Uncharacterized protein n=1 Tax=Acanthoscelides obtectus TaxID=200917 RepID=A0A9P0KZ80_ACAOB|nr:unnamed protein product [Acanthoscelides obtectus]CAK1650625.1 hypothetical protein AOBTE_LOCUS16834 [Acanthoscelides obtectus]
MQHRIWDEVPHQMHATMTLRLRECNVYGIKLVQNIIRELLQHCHPILLPTLH